MTDGLKERPASLRRLPRPAPDEKVDPVDYSPAAVAPAPANNPAPTGGGAEPAAAPAVTAPVRQPAPEPAAQIAEAPAAAPAAPPAPAPARQSTRSTKASKPSGNKKTSRREVTFPLSTRLSQEVLDMLYTATEDEGISVREAIEQAIKHRWG